MKYKRGHTAHVERFNKEIGEQLFKIQDAQELDDPSKDSDVWEKHLYAQVDQLNKQKNDATGITPSTAINLEKVPKKQKDHPSEKLLPKDGLYRYLYQHGKQHKNQRRRATDLNWSKDNFRLDGIVQGPDNRVLYYLKDGPKRAFVREELMLKPEDTELSPEYVKDW